VVSRLLGIRDCFNIGRNWDIIRNEGFPEFVIIFLNDQVGYEQLCYFLY
jgi:hypothetical protein